MVLRDRVVIGSTGLQTLQVFMLVTFVLQWLEASSRC